MKRCVVFLVCLLLTACLSNTGTSPTAQAQPTVAVLATTAPVVKRTATPEAVTGPDYFNLPADSVELKATEEEINNKLQEISAFGIGYSEANGTYDRYCLLEKLNFLKEGSYINIGDFDVRVTGECSYLDANRIKQTALVAMVIQNSVEKTTWLPYRTTILPFVDSPEFVQEHFTVSTEIEPGMILLVAFNLPNEQNLNFGPAAKHHGRAVEQLYTPEEIEAYVDTGNPDFINNLIIPYYVSESENFESLGK